MATEEVPLSSLLSSGSQDPKKDKKCFICNKKFGLGKKYQCLKCENFICAKHSLKFEETLETKKRICDVCDMENIRQEVKKEILEELSKLKQSIDIAKESYEKVECSRVEKTRIVKELEEEVLKTEKMQKAKEEELQNKILEETIRTQKSNQSIDTAKKEIEELYIKEKEVNQLCIENEEKNERMKIEIRELKEKKTEMLAQIEHLTGKLKGSLPKDQVISLICESCKKKVQGDVKYHNNDADSAQDDVHS
jgi:chromosome segregation ATPase